MGTGMVLLWSLSVREMKRSDLVVISGYGIVGSAVLFLGLAARDYSVPVHQAIHIAWNVLHLAAAIVWGLSDEDHLELRFVVLGISAFFFTGFAYGWLGFAGGAMAMLSGAGVIPAFLLCTILRYFTRRWK